MCSVMRNSILVLAMGPALCAFGRETEQTQHKWKAQLATALAKSDRIVVRRVQPDVETGPVLWQIRGRKHIDAFLAALEIDDSRSGPVDGCNGDAHLHFYAGNSKVLVMGWHHGNSIRWHDGKWQGDGWLTARSQRAVPAWFAQQGFDELQKARERDFARRRQRDAQAKTFAQFFPKGAREVVLDGPKLSAREFRQYDQAAGEQIAKLVDDPVTLTVACCQALGVSTTTWTSTGLGERRVLAAVKGVGGKDFLQALQILQRKQESRRGLLGAARLFFRQGFDARLEQSQRSTWALVLAEAVVRHGKTSSKPQLLRYLARQRDPAVDQVLYEVATGKLAGDTGDHGTYQEEPVLRAGAVLALAQRGDRRAQELASEQLMHARAPQNVAAFEISLALMGDPKYLKPQQFTLRSYSLGYAALDAIERFGGAHGMDILVNHATRHPWAQVRKAAIQRFEKITGASISEKGRNTSRARQQVQSWWLEHGRDFVRQRT